MTILVISLMLVIGALVLVVLVLSLRQLGKTIIDVKAAVDTVRSKQELLEQQFLQPLLELQQVKTTVQTMSGLSERLQQDLLAIEQRIQERLKTVAQESRERDQQDRGILESIANVVARTVRKGRAGEDVIRDALRSLQPMYVATNHPIKGGVVEFAVKLTDTRIMPLDSKWVASDLLEAYAGESDERRREELRKTIEDRVLKHVREVAKYLDATVTTDLALCAIPDAAYEVLTKAVTQAYQEGVLIVPYSEVLPLVLSLLHLFRRYTGSIDLEELKGRLGQLRMDLAEMQTVLDNNLQKGSTMIQNAIETYRQLLGTMRASLSAVKRLEPPQPAESREHVLGGVS